MENQFKGTKGNWRVREDEPTVVENDMMFVITETDYPNVPKDQLIANAQLIACAPEMLDMLYKMLQFSEQIEASEMYAEIKELIKKATTI